jgi:hypothetical protein
MWESTLVDVMDARLRGYDISFVKDEICKD